MASDKEKDTKNKKPSNPEGKKPAREKAPKEARLPILWETVSTLSQLTITLTGLAVAVISYIHGSNLLMSAVRAGAAMLCLGIVLYVIYWMVARGSLDMMFSLYQERQKEIRNNSSSSTREFRG